LSNLGLRLKAGMRESAQERKVAAEAATYEAEVVPPSKNAELWIDLHNRSCGINIPDIKFIFYTCYFILTKSQKTLF
jgi:hypothetical protein